eukprot:6317158-Pyramimonas_sp.AAC.1
MEAKSLYSSGWAQTGQDRGGAKGSSISLCPPSSGWALELKLPLEPESELIEQNWRESNTTLKGVGALQRGSGQEPPREEHKFGPQGSLTSHRPV